MFQCKGPVASSESFALRVFWLEDGSKIGKWPIPVEQATDNEASESKPALRLVDGGVSVGGKEWRFDGRDLRK